MKTNDIKTENWKKNINLFLSSQTISLFGSSLVQYAIMWYITLETKSGVMMTISILCGFLPTFILSPFAGVWADRYYRKKLIILADSLVAASTLVLAIVFLNGYNEIWLLFVVSAVRAVGTGIQTPAVGAVFPQIVPADKLTRVNGINASLQSLTMLISPMISGVLLTFAKIEYIFFIDVVTAAIAIVFLLFFIPIPVHVKALQKQTSSYFADLKQGIVYIKNHTFLMHFFLFYAIFFFLIAPVAFLTPLQIARSFGDEVWRLTANEVAYSAGMMIGGVMIAVWGGFKKNKVYTMVLSSLVIGISICGLGIIPLFWAYLAVIGLIGIMAPLFGTPSTVLIQKNVEEAYMGRVFGVLVMITTSMLPLGMVLFGPLADSIKIEWLLIVTGSMVFVLGLFLAGNKALVNAGKQ